ncbi:hypothetical protein RM543_11410 [Roseicyclus sp. F158]|uniref:Glycerol-3-phosphate dehydrogenase n=1 Tax=Tropicimonas omnivorans TaxID=3075590 RepID=A0ABU3DHY1_9RHOB|nr:hypothetical protein [Roseicyclus sp. F158]MDT0683297.1 hypothetical protein [Roseicyclus sp. F158]
MSRQSNARDSGDVLSSIRRLVAADPLLGPGEAARPAIGPDDDRAPPPSALILMPSQRIEHIPGAPEYPPEAPFAEDAAALAQVAEVLNGPEPAEAPEAPAPAAADSSPETPTRQRPWEEIEAYTDNAPAAWEPDRGDAAARMGDPGEEIAAFFRSTFKPETPDPHGCPSGTGTERRPDRGGRLDLGRAAEDAARALRDEDPDGEPGGRAEEGALHAPEAPVEQAPSDLDTLGSFDPGYDLPWPGDEDDFDSLAPGHTGPSEQEFSSSLEDALSGADGLGGLDEAALSELVTRIVHRELQGSLGERITRNVRKLVRSEVERALELRRFD